MKKKPPDVPSTLSNSPVWRWLRRQIAPPSNESETLVLPVTGNDSRRIVVKNDDCCGISDVGLVREGNEDAFYVDPEQGLLVVADGLGGHAAGEVASALAIETICTAVKKHNDQHEPRALLDLVFAKADEAVREHARNNQECAGMGATLVVALIRHDQFFVAHVGDVRAYHWHNDKLNRLTEDHTAVGRLLRAGLIEEDAARHHPGRNQVDQAIGGANPAKPEHIQITLAPGDCLLLCSDGLWDEVPHADIAAVLADTTPAFHLATRLIDKAIAAGGRDNVTAVVYRHHDHAGAAK